MSDVPNEFRVDCGECGFDGGTYDFRADPDPPAFCPSCGTAAEESDHLHIVAGEDEPTSLTWDED